MPTQLRVHLNEQVLSTAKAEIAKYGNHIALDKQLAIFEQRVVLGMSPYEAKLAAGAFQYGVNAGSKWPANTDPVHIMWHQSVEPDDSKIFMIFMNKTQFPELGMASFRVEFEQGQGVRIQRSENGEWLSCTE